MKLVSWNVNGLRAIHRKGNWGHVWDLKPDILCMQETKAAPEQLVEELLNVPGYQTAFSSSKVKKGYSGVGIYSKYPIHEPIFGMGIPKFDDEGRVVGAYYDDFVLLNVYFPNGAQPGRLSYKLEFYEAFLGFIQKLRAEGYPVVFCGDVNTAHMPVDIYAPEKFSKTTGFLTEERAWIDRLVDAGFIDIFRALHPQQKDIYTYWDLFTGARDRNHGWRIDYFFVSDDLADKVTSAKIHNEVYGSDHCPTSIELDL